MIYLKMLFPVESSPVSETKVTSKRTTTIPSEIREALAIALGTVVQWKIEGETIRLRKKRGVLNELQKHIEARAGSWRGKISGEELLKRTRE
jgi:bifunctional DNA-binding transcriptional regulator/antitoxin component of YhaV-PrlF toxin-antitoxin module